MESNRVRVGIGHVGDGPPDDSGAVPTPGIVAPGPPIGVAATNLNPTDVQTILQQAASAATALGRRGNNHRYRSRRKRARFLPDAWCTRFYHRSERRQIGPGSRRRRRSRSRSRNCKSIDGCILQHHRQCIHNSHGRLHNSGTFSTRNQLSRRRPALWSSVLFSSLRRHQNTISATRSFGGSWRLADLQKRSARGRHWRRRRWTLHSRSRSGDEDQPFEELIAASGIRGFEAPTGIRGNNILVDGIRLPFSNVTSPPAPTTVASIAGATISFGPGGIPPDSEFVPQVVGGIAGEVSPRFFPLPQAQLPPDQMR